MPKVIAATQACPAIYGGVNDNIIIKNLSALAEPIWLKPLQMDSSKFNVTPR